MLRVLDDDESGVDDLSAAPAPSDDPVGAWTEDVMWNSGVEMDAVDASVAPYLEGPDAPTRRRDLDDHELDECRPSQNEDERRPTMPARPATSDPVARQAEAVDATRPHRGALAATRPAAALTCATWARAARPAALVLPSAPTVPRRRRKCRRQRHAGDGRHRRRWWQRGRRRQRRRRGQRGRGRQRGRRRQRRYRDRRQGDRQRDRWEGPCRKRDSRRREVRSGRSGPAGHQRQAEQGDLDHPVPQQ